MNGELGSGGCWVGEGGGVWRMGGKKKKRNMIIILRKNKIK